MPLSRTRIPATLLVALLLLGACAESPPPDAAATDAPVAADAATTPVAFAVGDAVEIEASGHWVPCVVAENHPEAIMRVRCTSYPALSRDAGVYTVDRDNPAAVRPASGAIGKPESVSLAPPPSSSGGGLRIGDYACYGSGGRAMIGLGFRVVDDGEYTDLDGVESGRFVVGVSDVHFEGGHLDGMEGRELRGQRFRLGDQAECEPE